MSGRGIWIKQDLPLISPFGFFSKSSFRDRDVVLGSCTTEKSEVSSANNLATGVNPLGRSVILTKKIVVLVWNPEEFQL